MTCTAPADDTGGGGGVTPRELSDCDPIAYDYCALPYPSSFYLRDDALVEHLSRDSHPAAARFRTWVDRDISFPGRRIRRDLGIRPEPPDADERMREPEPAP